MHDFMILLLGTFFKGKSALCSLLGQVPLLPETTLSSLVMKSIPMIFYLDRMRLNTSQVRTQKGAAKAGLD